MKDAVIRISALNNIKQEYTKLRKMLDEDIKQAVENYQSDGTPDNKCMDPMDFAFLSGRCSELEKFLKLCNVKI